MSPKKPSLIKEEDFGLRTGTVRINSPKTKDMERVIANDCAIFCVRAHDGADWSPWREFSVPKTSWFSLKEAREIAGGVLDHLALEYDEVEARVLQLKSVEVLRRWKEEK